MTETKQAATKPANTDERQIWSTPTVRRMRAGDAENAYTRTRNDGQFSFS